MASTDHDAFDNPLSSSAAAAVSAAPSSAVGAGMETPASVVPQEELVECRLPPEVRCLGGTLSAASGAAGPFFYLVLGIETAAALGFFFVFPSNMATLADYDAPPPLLWVFSWLIGLGNLCTFLPLASLRSALLPPAERGAGSGALAALSSSRVGASE